MNIAEEVLGLISTIGKIPRHQIGLQTAVYNSGIISSLNLLELMSHIEKRFSIVVRPEELIERNFKDVNAIVRFIETKVGPGQ
ncbi:MAG: acyl carrier protein [Chitinivibrionales bacterium]|nr:acyl carrier protein [Chitinivibrionales bacterium]